MEMQMAFFEAKVAAVASALTPLLLVASFHSVLSRENSVTGPARLAAQDGILGFLLVAHNRLARGGPLHLYRSSEGKIEHKTAQPKRNKSFRSRARLSRIVREGASIKDQQRTCASFTKISGQ
jgi:hypothetical protein